MNTVRTVSAVRAAVGGWVARGESVGFVPTMGYLHDGHLSLVARAREENARVVASIFVNPTQFAPGEDLDRYPRDGEGDAAKLRQAGADLLFTPEPEEIYPEGFQTHVEVERVSMALCGLRRPGHFRGVATVVTKLLNIVRPRRVYLGAKDYQQCVVVRRLVRDLNIDTDVVVCPTVREADGLAMSSRNAYLSPGERRAATVLFRALQAGVGVLATGGAGRSVEAVRRALETTVVSEPLATLEYAEVRDAETVEEISSLGGAVVMALAVRIGSTRLIDNAVVEVPEADR